MLLIKYLSRLKYRTRYILLELLHCLCIVFSAEFDDVELCNSLSRPSYGSVCNSCHQHGNSSQPNDLLVQDLRAQLSRCHKVIRGLQIRMRSLSTTSDYASSLERTPRKVQFSYKTIFILYTYQRASLYILKTF